MNPDRLNILWTNADETTAELMVFMYAVNSLKGELWKDVRIIIWGATAKLVAENINIQKHIAEAMSEGVQFSACLSCAEKLGVKDIISNLGIELILWGRPLTDIIKSEEKLLTI